jgi:hypothetical protein
MGFDATLFILQQEFILPFRKKLSAGNLLKHPTFFHILNCKTSVSSIIYPVFNEKTVDGCLS